MQGLIHRADIYRRVNVGGGSQWEITPFITDYECRVDSISPSRVLRKQFAMCTHSAVGEYNADLGRGVQGMRMVITSSGWCAGMTFPITGVRHMDAGTSNGHHCEIMLTEPKL